MVTNYATLYIRCTPDDDATVFDSSCTSRLNAANSKAALILPRRNMPRSPPFFAEPHSENFLASSWKSERRRCVGAACVSCLPRRWRVVSMALSRVWCL